MDSDLDLSDRRSWWSKHENDCQTEWACKLEYCGKNSTSRQMHFTMCFRHTRDNKAREKEFVKTLDQTLITPAVKFFYSDLMFFPVLDVELPDPPSFHPGVEVLKDNVNPAIFMLQELFVGNNKRPLQAFYDSGCSNGAISDSAYNVLDTTNIRPGPTEMGVAGGQTIVIPGGVERFYLNTTNDNQKAEMQGIRMPEITSPFPIYPLKEAYNCLVEAWNNSTSVGLPPLPEVPDQAGGKSVDVMIGISYLRYFPELVYSLPCGLSIFKAKFQTPDGNLGILGGPHQAWRRCREVSDILTPVIFFSNEMLAYRIESNLIGARNLDFVHAQTTVGDGDVELFDLLQGFEEVIEAENVEANKELEDLLGPFTPRSSTIEQAENCGLSCQTVHCDKHKLETGWVVPDHWDVTDHMYNVKGEADEFENLENVGSEISYRCLRCRNCADCRKGEFFEKTSLMEEVEQALIESCVWLDVSACTLISKMPFIKDPVTSLAPNRHQAAKILESQVRTISKDEQMKADVIKAHNKLLDNGHVVAIRDLPPEIRKVVEQAPMDYTIPWTCVRKDGSVSTPYRLVFNASFKTKSGESLNSILPKGANKLPKILHLLIRFASNKAAFCADVSMAYNSVKILPEYYCFQKYLWKANLEVEDEIVDMIIGTLIYGVKHAGNATTSGFEKTADYAMEHTPEDTEGALVVKDHTYMDDSMKAEDTPGDCRRIAGQMVRVMAIGGMKIKDFTFSGTVPSDKVSADGKTVGVLGYYWWSMEDEISLNIKDLFIGKAKRGKAPVPVQGSVKEALWTSFTKRTLTGKVAGVFDPRGLVAAITSRLKLCLAEIVDLKLGWDDQIPEKFLDVWVQNLDDIQRLKTLRFPRSFLHPEAIDKQVRLIVSVDASQGVCVATVHAQSVLPDGQYSCRLVTAKSKLVHLATIPRAELRGAVLGATLGHIVKFNLGKQCKDIIYITDSTIVLFWLNQDSRPLQTAVRNAVIEVRRLTDISKWFHVESAGNVADIGTRFTEVESLGANSPWAIGLPWMSKPFNQMPIKSLGDILMDQKDVRAAQQEMKAADVCGFTLPRIKDQVSERYSFSKYVVDPCVMSWDKSVRVLAFVHLFIAKLKKSAVRRKLWEGSENIERARSAELVRSDVGFGLTAELAATVRNFQLTTDQVSQAERYFFMKATRETKQFSKQSEYKNCSKMVEGILTYSGRILDGQQIDDVENVMGDINPLSFARPVVDRFSPVAYSVAIYCHQKRLHHKNTVATLRESRNICFILKGRDLTNEITAACTYCRRYKAKIMDVEMGKVHPSRLTIAPAFYSCVVDCFGPYTAHCEHNHRSSIDVWGIIFKDPASSAIAVYAMPRSDTSAVLQAYNRHSFRYGHPAKIFIDGGTQLIKACSDMEVNWTELASDINSQYGTGVEFEVCPPNAHYMHGAVERSVLEVKRIFNAVFAGLKMELFSFETAFAFCANELNNLPICLGSKYDNLGSTDIITPNRLLLGRNNRSAPVGFTGMAAPSELVSQMEVVHKSWWKVWMNEKLADFIPKPSKWDKTTGQPEVGDLVVFVKDGGDDEPGDTLWRIGIIDEFKAGPDGLVRRAWIKYKNNSQCTGAGYGPFRSGGTSQQTHQRVQRAVRDIAVLHREAELEVFEQLNQAAKEASLIMLMRTRSGAHTTMPDWKTSVKEEVQPPEFKEFVCLECDQQAETPASTNPTVLERR